MFRRRVLVSQGRSDAVLCKFVLILTGIRSIHTDNSYRIENSPHSRAHINTNELYIWSGLLETSMSIWSTLESVVEHCPRQTTATVLRIQCTVQSRHEYHCTPDEICWKDACKFDQPLGLLQNMPNWLPALIHARDCNEFSDMKKNAALHWAARLFKS